MSKISGGALGWLDGLGNAAVSLSGAAITTAANVAAARETLKGPKTSDQTPVNGIASIQTAVTGIPWVWVGVGAAVLVGGFLLLRRKG